MKQCPKCGSTMIWYMIYSNGEPKAYWKCICGYDQRSIRYTYSTQTTSGEFVRKFDREVE